MSIKLIKGIAGIILIIIGIIGLFLPVIPGVLLILAGLILLGVKKEQIHKWIKKLKLKYTFWIFIFLAYTLF